jgi:hypothetical protein
MRNFFLLRSLLVIGNSLSISIGFLTFFIVSASLIFSGIPREISIELATAASLGTGSFIAFIDSLIGISSSITKQQKARLNDELNLELHLGQISPKQALQKIIRRQYLTEISEIPLFDFSERGRVKRDTDNRYWAVQHVLPHTLSSLSNISIENLCRHLDEVENIVAQNIQQGKRRLLPASQARDIAEEFFKNQQLSLPE